VIVLYLNGGIAKSNHLGSESALMALSSKAFSAQNRINNAKRSIISKSVETI
jgi:hypothetical protein